MSDYSWNMSDLENALGITYDELDDEIKGLDESKALKTNKTLAEIERFIVDEKLTELEKALHLLKTGSSTQKMWVFTELPNLSKSNTQEFYNILMPEILNIISGESSQIQKSFCQSVISLLSNANETPIDSAFVVSSLYPKLKKLGQTFPNDEEWDDALLMCFEFMDQNTIVNEILAAAISSAGMSQPVKNRMWCCKVIGKITRILPPEILEKFCLKKALELSQDTDYEVRSSMSSQLSYLAASLGWDKTKSLIFNDYKELLIDEHEEVRLSALEHLPIIVEQMDSEFKKKEIWPFWKQLLEDSLSFSEEELVAKDFGLIFWNLKDVLDPSEKLIVAKRFFEFVKSGSPKLRQMAAFNFPAFLKIADQDGFETFNISAIMKLFEDEKISDVKKKYAQGFHEVAVMLSGKATKRARESFVKLVSDPDCSIVIAVLENSDQFLYFLKEEKEENLPNDMFALISNLTTRLGKLKWREQKNLLLCFRKIVPFFDSEIEYNFASKTLIPLLKPQSNCRPVAKAIIKSVVYYSRLMKKIECRERLIKDMIDELKFSTCYLHRIYFLEFCRYSLEYGSKKFFRENLLSHYLDMHRDSAANIRLKMVLLAADARKTLRVLFKESSLSLKWFEAFQRLSSVLEKDEQVRAIATEIMNNPIEFAEKDVKELKILGSLSKSEYYLNANDRMNESEEQLDQEKEEEEEKYKIQQMYLDEAMRRRELEEAKNEFSRRLKAEKRNSNITKSTGNGLKNSPAGMKKVSTSSFIGTKTTVTGNSNGSTKSLLITKSQSFANVGAPSSNSSSIASVSSPITAAKMVVNKSVTEVANNSYSVTSKSSPVTKVDSPRTATKANADSSKNAPVQSVQTASNKSNAKAD